MADRLREIPNSPEIITPEKAKYLAGLFETGGTLTFKFGGENGRFPQPEIRYKDNDKEGLERLREIFGGGSIRSDEDSFIWDITGEKVIKLAEAMKPFSPSRSEFMQVITNWSIKTTDQRYEEATNFINQQNERSRAQRRNVPPGSYDHLLNDAHFLAGVIDRSSVFSSPDRNGLLTCRFSLSSTNQELLQALEKKYGGNVNRTARIIGRSKEPSTLINWQISGVKAAEIYAKINSSLLIHTKKAQDIFKEWNINQIKDLIMIFLSENPQGISAAELSQKLQKMKKISLGLKAVIYLMKPLLETKRISVKKNLRRRPWIWTFDPLHPINFPLLSQSPIALEQFLKGKLTVGKGIFITTTGDIRGIGDGTPAGTEWYGRGQPTGLGKKLVEQAINDRQQFVEIFDHEHLVFVPDISKITDIKQGMALLKHITYGLDRALYETTKRYAQLGEPLPFNFSSEKVALDILRAAGYRLTK